jgi:hypothetical protein
MEAEGKEPKNRRTEEPKNRRALAFGSLVLWFFGHCPGSLVLWFFEHSLVCVLILAPLFTSPGCRSHAWLRRTSGDPPPIAFSALPSPTEAVGAVNANTNRVQSLQTQGATISIPGAPSIGADIAVERPNRLRLRAKTQLLGPELDLGSNDELFWLWAARMPDSSVFFARHDQFATSRAKQMLAIEPAWLIEALGLVQIDPASVIEGPHADGNDRVKLRTTLASGGGQYTRLLILHNRYAWVLEQHVYDENSQLIASARNSGHEYHTVDGVSLPKRIEVQVPQGLLRLQLDIDRWAINQPLAEAATTFELPRSQLANYPFVDMADPRFVPPAGSTPVQPTSAPRTAPKQPQNEISRRLRGFSAWR